MISPWYARTRELTMTMVKHASVTNTPGEVSFADHLLSMLCEHPYFQEHPAQAWKAPIPDDPWGRSNVFALVQGQGAATVLLSGHYDVVSVKNYGQLEQWACDPEALLPRLVAELHVNGRSAGDEQALHDLEGGAFLPGRGTLDMKSGLAAGLAVLFHAAEQPLRPGNLLLVATPDEENSSYGMRGATATLPELLRQWQLELVAAINLDSTGDAGDGHDGRAIFFGSVGKLLPSAYIVGRDTHAGFPFDGFNPNLVAAELTRRMECNVALADAAEGEVAPPPTCLQQIDLKEYYDVTTPGAAWCVYNVLTHGRSTDDVLALFRAEVEEALAAAVDVLAERGRRYAALTGTVTPRWVPAVYSFAELKAEVAQRCGAACLDEWNVLAAELADDRSLHMPDLNRRLTEALWRRSGLAGPAVVIGFASLYYPPVLVGTTRQRHVRLRQVAAHQAALASGESGGIALRSFFPGISDMSLLGSSEGGPEPAMMMANTPCYGSRIRFDYAAIAALDVPMINVGPWGRDYHQKTERVYMPYTFGLLPALINGIAGELLARTAEEDGSVDV